ncbi:hypothetical protein BJX96DRAFT_175687 [Aspergillus floccosus]
MAFTTFVIINFLLAISRGAIALPQAVSKTVSDASSSVAIPLPSANASGIAAALPEAVLNSLPIIPVEGDDSAAIVQSSNSSLLATHPEIDVDPTHDLPELPTANRICDFWFPNNQVFYVPAPLPAPGFVQVKVPLGPALPTLNVKYQTVNPAPVTDLFTPLTSTICKKRFDSILAFATTAGNFQCPAPPNVHSGNDCDVTSRAACFSFYLN